MEIDAIGDETCATVSTFLFFERKNILKRNRTQKLALTSIFTAISVVGGLFSFPIFGSRASIVQHMVNLMAAVLLGPWYGVAAAFSASLLRNLFGLGTILAFPGSMIGAWLAGFAYQKTGHILAASLGEIIGTGILGGLTAWPLAILFLGQEAGNIAFYIYVIPFLISTVIGTMVASSILMILKRTRGLHFLGEGN